MTASRLVVSAFIFALAACGGGGGGSGSPDNVVPGGAPGTQSPTPQSPNPQRSATPPPQTPPPKTPSPKPTPTPISTSTPGSTPTPSASYPPSGIPNTAGRIGLAQIFDSYLGASEIASNASRYDLVWATSRPTLWRSAHPATIGARYYILEEDNTIISGLDLAWWQKNHPDWIMYACDASGNPTRDVAYTPGDGFADIPLDIHNPSVVDYQIRQSLVPYVVRNGYNAVGIDEVIFHDVMLGGNPFLGGTKKAGEFGCGIWNDDGTFTKRWSSPSDPRWNTDIVNWIVAARRILNTDPGASPYHLRLVVNHPAGSTGDSNERTLLSNVDATMDEAGFSDYGNYNQPAYQNLFGGTISYMKFVQSLGVAFVDIDKFADDPGRANATQVEYSIATYLLGNEGSADLFVGGHNGPDGYGAEQYFSEYNVPLGAACGSMYGGAGYDARNPHIYYRRFAHGMAVVNSGSLPVLSERATLLSHTYTDMEGRPVANPLTVNSNDAYVLTTSANGCS